jgi:hypothetical protein
MKIALYEQCPQRLQYARIGPVKADSDTQHNTKYHGQEEPVVFQKTV